MQEPRILLVIGGGIAAYKACELVRLIRKGGGSVTCVVTEAGQQFVTPMTLAALSEKRVYTTLWDLKNETEMGHIQLSREADLVVVCPATADLMAKMVAGISDDLATTLLLATDKPVLAVPAMNVRMWLHSATVKNVAWLRKAGVQVMEPDDGNMACGEYGPGRLPEPEAVWQEIARLLGIAPAGNGEAAEPLPEDHRSEDQAEAWPPASPEQDVEAVEEPEPEQASESHWSGGLGGLLASIIPRATPRRAEQEPEWEPEPDMPAEAIEEEWPDVEEEIPEFKPGGPLLARKGSASAAPPTDPDAINHEVANSTGGAVPEPMEVAGRDARQVDQGAAAPAEADPLEGQPAFDINPAHRPLYGKHILITAGPTHEPIDPVRFIANRSSGKQGYAIAAAAAAAGARVTLISGPVNLDTPPGVDRIDVETAVEMSDAVKKMLPADAAIMVAAVADWRSKDIAEAKMKKRQSAPPALRLVENPDILANVAAGSQRPRLVIGFAAETDDIIENAKSKRSRKGCDWIVANDVSGDVMGGERNSVHIVTADDVESWDDLPKEEVAFKLIERVADVLA